MGYLGLIGFPSCPLERPGGSAVEYVGRSLGPERIDGPVVVAYRRADGVGTRRPHRAESGALSTWRGAAKPRVLVRMAVRALMVVEIATSRGRAPHYGLAATVGGGPLRATGSAEAPPRNGISYLGASPALGLVG